MASRGSRTLSRLFDQMHESMTGSGPRTAGRSRVGFRVDHVAECRMSPLIL
jgi:hypothetical protein